MTRLSGSVGEGGGDDASNVKYVQALLVDWQIVQRRTPLRIDGICGPLTKAAILEFQRAETLASDGRMDPGGPTIARMEACHVDNLLVPLLGLAHYAIISPMRPSHAWPDDSKPVERYLSALRESFDQRR